MKARKVDRKRQNSEVSEMRARDLARNVKAQHISSLSRCSCPPLRCHQQALQRTKLLIEDPTLSRQRHFVCRSGAV